MIISICSFLFSYLLIKSLSILTNSKEEIENLFRNEEKIMRKNKKYKLNNIKKKIIYNKLLGIYKCLKIKIIYYIIIEFLLLLFFFYYITAFCEVYRETQMSWLYDSLLSFIISIPFEFCISFLISMLYILSIQYHLKFLYKIAIFFYGLG